MFRVVFRFLIAYHVLLLSYSADTPECKKTLSLCALTTSNTNFLNQRPKGETGLMGPPGKKGEKGDAGTKGHPGKVGARGEPGINGRCPCDNPEIKPLCISDNVISSVCKNSAKIGIENYIRFGRVKKEIICEPRKGLTTLTCLPKKMYGEGEMPTYKYPSDKKSLKGFWVSSHNEIKLEDLYDFSRSQFEMFIKMSNSAFQTIRFHCFNSIPFLRENLEKSLLLSTWNEKPLGPVATSKHPVYYYVSEKDGCATTQDEWSYTDITIFSKSNKHVPIIDFYIRDIRENVTQLFKIEHLKLCFD